MAAPLADRQELRIKNGGAVKGILVNGARPKVVGPLSYIGCSGRACRTRDVTLFLTRDAPLPEITWQRTYYGAGSAADRIIAARPDTAQPVHSGDQRILIRAVKLGSP
ncbi:hypothetical protein FHS49_002401 [Sphingobium boeckii]|uniref:Uncharacterized protein n=1 Tax=Sphingobium boeckii TaxID=1082345 RepID=A0A7W9AIM6_9SPHN|nr:hypothetical protein [Sphingobium boeckii]